MSFTFIKFSNDTVYYYYCYENDSHVQQYNKIRTMTCTRLLLLQTSHYSNLSALSLVKNVPTVIGRFLTPKLNIPISI